MKTRIDAVLGEYLTNIVNDDKKEDAAVMYLLDQVREAFDLDVVYLVENTNYHFDFEYTFLSQRNVVEENSVKLFHVTDPDYAKIIAKYAEEELGEEQYESTKELQYDYVLRYVLLRKNEIQGSVGFQSKEKRVWSEEEREALKKLGRIIRFYMDSKQRKAGSDENFKEYVDALTSATISDYYVDLIHNTCYVLKIVDRLKNVIPKWGSYDAAIHGYANKCLDEDFREEMISKFSIEYLQSYLTPENRVVEMDFRRKIDGKTMWFRQSAVLVDTNEEGKPHHIIVTVKDVTEILTQEDRNRYALLMLKDSYYRISSIDPVNNDIVVIKALEDERREEGAIAHDLEAAINFIAEYRVHPNDREKFLRILSPDNLQAFFEESKETISFNYRRLVRGEYQWVRSEIVPIDYYGDRNTHAIWYVKNISDEMVKKADLTVKLLESNAKIRNALESEEQFRKAVLSDTVMVYRFNLTKNIVEEEVVSEAENECVKVFEKAGMMTQCTYDEFMATLRQEVVEESKEVFDELNSCEKLIREFQHGKENITVEYKVKAGKDDSECYILRQTDLLMESKETGHIVGICFIKDVTEQRNNEYKAKETLQMAYEAASRANGAKTEFLSRMSHDIRTPMNAIIGMTAIAEAHLGDKDRVRDCLNKIAVSSKHLLALINEVLDMSKIESGKVKLAEEKFNLGQLLENLLDMIKPGIKEKHHNLRVNIQRIEHEDVIGDSIRIQQVFVNIVGNAVKYTNPGGEIEIIISEKNTNQEGYGCYEIIFQDNGMGMEPEFVKHLFEPFTRAEDDRVNKIQGTGLGMAITQNIVQMMNGTIGVESEVGKGTKFTVTIFLKIQNIKTESVEEFKARKVLITDTDSLAAESTYMTLCQMGMESETVHTNREALEKVLTAQKSGENYFAVILDGDEGEDAIVTAKSIREELNEKAPGIVLSAYDWSEFEMRARGAGVEAFVSKPLFRSKLTIAMRELLKGEHVETMQNPLDLIQKIDYSGKCVLIVEDNEINREIAKEFLEMTGMNVEEAVDGKEAVNKFMASPPRYYDLIFMDVQMPIMNGYEATSAIRSLNRRDAKRIPIIAMTANAFVEDVQAAVSAGMNEHMAKPLDIEQLQDILKRWLG